MIRPTAPWDRTAPRRGGFGAVLLRRLPGDSSMHRLWIGTKVISLLILTIATAFNTSWWQLAGVAAVTAAALIAGRVPPRALPRLPHWFWATIVIGFVLAANGNGAGEFLRFMGFAMVFLLLMLVIAWTTELSDLAPALSNLARPLRWVGAPVDEWALTAMLSVRCLPLMLDECRIALAARRQRPSGRRPDAVIRAVIDVVTASTAAAVRRADDLGEVIALRGGPPAPQRVPVRIAARDLAAFAIVLAASILPLAAGV